MNYLLVFFGIGIVILLHETGHFLVAKWTRIPIRIFSIGIGPKIWSYKSGRTEYRISLIPVGGYVLPDIADETEFFQFPAGKRMLMALGGPMANLIITLICLGIFNGVNHGLSWMNILWHPLYQTASLTGQMLAAIPALFTHHGQLSGIIGMVAEGGKYVAITSLNWLPFMALLSLNFTILNILPVPVLDGGKILLYLLEKIHPKLLRLHLPLAIAGWLFILGLMIYATINDIGRYIL